MPPPLSVELYFFIFFYCFRLICMIWEFLADRGGGHLKGNNVLFHVYGNLWQFGGHYLLVDKLSFLENSTQIINIFFIAPSFTIRQKYFLPEEDIDLNLMFWKYFMTNGNSTLDIVQWSCFTNYSFFYSQTLLIMNSFRQAENISWQNWQWRIICLTCSVLKLV